MANLESFGSTALDGRLESQLKEFAKGIKGEQVHLGRTQATSENFPRSVPLISGSNLVFAGDSEDANLVKWVRVAINTINTGNSVSLTSGILNPPSYTATSNSTVAAASGLAAACASHSHQNYLNFSWSSEGASVYGIAINISVNTTFGLLFSGDSVLYQTFPGAPVVARITMPNDLSGVTSVIGAPWLIAGSYLQNNHVYASAALELLGQGRHISLTDTEATVRRLDGPLSSSAIDLFDLGASWLYIGQQNLVLQMNKNGTAEIELTYDGFTEISTACTDGTHFYLIGSITTSDALAILKVDSNYDVVSCFTYADELGTNITPSYAGDVEGPIAQVVNDTIVIHCIRGGANPIWVGIQASNLAIVKWSKTSRKQELVTTIGINDTATTYRITIGGQTVSVSGDAGGANVTATVLKDACAASVLFQFTQFTWTASTNVVLGTRNVAGTLSPPSSASVVAGTGTISHSNIPYTSKFSPKMSRVDGDRIYFGGVRSHTGGSTFAGRKLEASTGSYDWTITTDEDPVGLNFNLGPAINGSEIYFDGSSGDPAQSFGQADISVTNLPLHQNNLTDEESSITLIITDKTADITRVDSTPPLINHVIGPPGRVVALNPFLVDDLDYTY